MKKILKWFFLSLFLLLLIILILLRIPAVQTKIAKVVVGFVENKTNTTINIDKVAINFIDHVKIKGLYVEDEMQDTLVYAQDLSVDVSIFKLLSKQIVLEEIYLNKPVIHINENDSGVFNFQYLIDAFASKDTTTNTESSFTFDVGSVDILQADIHVDLLNATNSIRFKELEIEANSLDIDSLHFDIENIHLEQANIKSIWKGDSVVDSTLIVTDSKTLFPLLGLPISVTCQNLLISKTDVLYQKGVVLQPKGFNSNLIDVKQLNIELDNTSISETGILTNINQLKGTLNNEIEIQNSKGELVFNEKGIVINDFIVKTAKTEVDLSAELAYNEFDELVNLSDKLRLESTVNKLELSVNELVFFVPELFEIAQIKNNLNEKLVLSGEVNGSFSKLAVNDLVLKLSKTNVKYTGILNDVLDYKNISFTNTQLDINTEVADLKKFLGSEYIKEEYAHFGNIKLNSNFSGDLKQLQINNVLLETSGMLQAQLNGVVRNLIDIDKLSYEVKIANIKTGINDVKAIQQDLPEILNKFKKIEYKGLLSGTKNNYFLKGGLNTSLGFLRSNLKLKFNEDFTNATYKGKLDLDTFKLGKLLDLENMGDISLKAKVNGSGLSIENLKAALEADVSSFSFNDYEYKNLAINGAFDKKKFEGKAEIKDNHVDFDFDGLLDFNDSIPSLDFTSNLAKFDADSLNLLDFPFQAKLKIDANIKGLNVDDIIGDIVIKDIVLENGIQKWATDSILFQADKAGEKNRQLKFESSILDFDISGNYSINNLPQVFMNFGDNFFPFSKLLNSEFVQDSTALNDEFVEVEIRVKDITPVAALFHLKLEKLDTAMLKFTLDAPNKLVDFDFFIPEIIYDGMYIDHIYATAKTKDSSVLATVFTIDSVAFNNYAYLPNFEFKANFFEQKAELNTIIGNNENLQNLNLNANLKKDKDGLIVKFREPFILNKKEWKLVNNDSISFSEDAPADYKLKISNASESIELAYKDNKFVTKLQQFNLSNLLNLVELDSTDIKGLINGEIVLENDSNLNFNSTLLINNIKLNDLNFGNLSLVSQKDLDNIQAEINVIGYENSLKATAEYNIASSMLDGMVDIKSFSIKTIEPLIKSYASNLSGELSGLVKFAGINAEQSIKGNLKFNQISAFVKPLGTQYQINTGNIEIQKDKLIANLILKDEDLNKANLTGNISHNSFSDFKFDLNLSSDNFTFLNAKKNTESLFYGKLIANTNINIKGNTDLPIINGSLKSRSGSDIVIQLISPTMAASQETYVVFVDGKDLSFDEIEKIASERYKSDFSMDVNLNIDIDETTNLNVIIDPLTGDNLALKGNAKLIVKLPPNGNLDIKGAYTVSSGSYQFSFQQILRKKFEISKRSVINFVGDPLLASLNIQALYKTSVSALSLIDNDSYVLTDDEKTALKRKSDAEILLNIGGKIVSPELSFDISLSENSSSPVGSSVTQALNRIRQNESELNKQVFSLLLFNTFTTSSSTGNVTSAGTSTAARSIGSLINTQLNKLTNKVNGLQLNFDLDQYENLVSEAGEQTTEIDIGLSQSLLNDRLTISLDGNLGLETGNSDQSAFSSLAGDFVLAYNITKDGKYKVRVFQQSDFDALSNSNVWKTGFGFSYQAKFGKINKVKYER